MIIIPHPTASEHRWLVKAPRWIQCPRCLGQAVVTLRLPCSIVESPRRNKRAPFVNIAYLCSWSIKRCQSKHKNGLLWRSFYSSSYPGVGLTHKTPGAGFRLVNSALEVLRESRSGYMVPTLFQKRNSRTFKDFSWTKSHFSSTMESLSSVLYMHYSVIK